MPGLLNMVKVNVTSTGTGTLTLGTAISSFLTLAGGGAVDGQAYSYVIEEGSAREVGWGVAGSSGTTLTRNLIASSTGSLLSLTGSAIMYISPNAKDLEVRPAYAANRYYAMMPGCALPTSAGSALVAGSLYLVPVFIEADTTISELYAHLTTGVSSQNAQFGLYAADATSLLPTGSPLYSSGNISTTTATMIGVTGLSLYLRKGWYWAGVMASSTPTFRTAAPSQGLCVLPYSCGVANVASVDARHFVKTGTFGTWPTLTGNQTTDSLSESESSSRGPILYFRP